MQAYCVYFILYYTDRTRYNIHVAIILLCFAQYFFFKMLKDLLYWKWSHVIQSRVSYEKFETPRQKNLLKWKIHHSRCSKGRGRSLLSWAAILRKLQYLLNGKQSQVMLSKHENNATETKQFYPVTYLVTHDLFNNSF